MTRPTLARALGFGVALVSALFAALAIMDWATVDYVPVPLNVAHKIALRLAELEEARASASRFDVAFLGDSTAGGQEQEWSIPRHLEAASNRLRGPAEPIRVVNLSSPGMGPFDYYFVSDLIVRAQPDAVFMLLNLTTFSENWTAGFRRPELAGWIPPSRFWQALTLPLYRVGVTADQLLVDMGLVNLDLLGPWRYTRREQARFNHAKNRFRNAIDREIGSGHQVGFAKDRMRHFERRYNEEGGERLSEIGVAQRFGAALSGVEADHFNLSMLGSTIEVFRDAGIPVWVYANPTNIDNIRKRGALDEQGLATTLLVTSQLVDALGAHWVDLHDLFPDDHFRDAGGHFEHRDPDAPRLLGQALAEAFVAAPASSLRAGDAGARD